jgi:hypothetical protein
MNGGLFVKEINPSAANPNDRMIRLRLVAVVRSRLEVFILNYKMLQILGNSPQKIAGNIAVPFNPKDNGIATTCS